MPSHKERDGASPSHQRPPFADPLPGGLDPTAPGAPHEPDGEATRQSRERKPVTPATSIPDRKETRPTSRPVEPDAA